MRFRHALLLFAMGFLLAASPIALLAVCAFITTGLYMTRKG